MGNCLVTKLKETVNNDSLGKLGVLKLKVANSSHFNATFPENQYDFSTITREEATLTVLSDGCVLHVYAPATKIDDKTAHLIDNGGVCFTSVSGDEPDYFIVEVNNKYALQKMSPLCGFDSSALEYLTNISKLETVGCLGTINDFVKWCPNLYDVAFYAGGEYTTKLSGRFSDLIGYSTQLTYISIASTSNAEVSSLEDAVAIRRAKGQTSNPGNGVRITISGSGAITFNGATVNNITNQWLTWTPTTITFNGVTIDNSNVAVL